MLELTGTQLQLENDVFPPRRVLEPHSHWALVRFYSDASGDGSHAAVVTDSGDHASSGQPATEWGSL